MRSAAAYALRVVALLSAVGAGAAASASTMTFDAFDVEYEERFGPYVEDGITFTPRSPGSIYGPWMLPGTLYMDDGGSGYSAAATFTMAKPFRPVGFDVIGRGSNYISPEGMFGAPFDNIRIEAFRSGTRTYATQFFGGRSLATSRFELPEGVGFADTLVISGLRPDFALLGGGECNDSPCSGFHVDNVELTPIPLPLPAALLAGGMVALVLLRRGRGKVTR